MMGNSNTSNGSIIFPDMNPEPVIRCSKDGMVMYANPVAQTLINCWQEQRDTDVMLCWEKPLALLCEQGAVVYDEWFFQDKYYVICFSPVPGEGKDILAVHCYFHDVTKRVAIEHVLQEQSKVLAAVAQVSSMILGAHDLHMVMPQVLGLLGAATAVSRVYVFELHQLEAAPLCASQVYEWVDEGIEAQLDNPGLQNIPFREAGFGRWLDLFLQGKSVVGLVQDFPEAEQVFLAEQGILSMLVMPVYINNQVWGFIGFDACVTACVWTEEKKNALSIAASSIGAALERQEDEQSLFVQNQALKTARDQALQANKAKSEFLAVMSHELRTPIHGAIGMLQLLQETKGLSPEQQEYLEAALTSSKSLKLLVNDILDLSKAEADQIELYAEPFDVLDCIQDVVSSLRYDVVRKGLYLRLEMLDVPAMVIGDVVRVRQILLNIMGNAVKFTAIGGITIRVSMVQDHIRFSIKDTGIGIAKDKQETIFEPFTQADASVNREFHGTGLGTTIAKRFVELLGGHIEVRSRQGWGSCFTFDFSCPASGDALISLEKDMLLMDKKVVSVKQQRTVALPEHTHVSVLVAEDDPIGQKIILKRLKRAGFTITMASHGLEAWDWAQRKDFDLVILDMQMPGMNGADVAKHIRTLDSKTGRALIIGITAHALSEIKTQCIAAGMDDFMTKPLDAKQVIAKIVHRFGQAEMTHG